MAKIEETVTKYLEPIIEKNNYELVDLEFKKEGANWYLRVYMDKEGGFTINDCEEVSRFLEQKLDADDPIEQAYILEVSSPGLDRPLKKEADFVKFAGSVVDIKLYKAREKRKEFQGVLKGLENNVVTIEDEDGTEISFNREEIASVKLAVLF